MKLFIPTLGSKLRLTKRWTFNLEWERRNFPLIKQILGSGFMKEYHRLEEEARKEWWRCPWAADNNNKIQSQEYIQLKTARDAHEAQCPKSFTFEKGEVLEVDRIYVRKGAEKFSSMTFKCPMNGGVARFWANLNDINKLDCQVE